MKTTINTSKAPEPIGPYNQCIKVNGFYYISGQIAIDVEGGNELKTDNIEDETKQVMKNIGFILEEAGLSYDDLVKLSIYLNDLNDFGTVNKTYGQYFEKHYPARECVEVSKLPKGVNIEISGIAAE
ncbi:MAG: RidA family protein [Flavobacteriales bacterium]